MSPRSPDTRTNILRSTRRMIETVPYDEVTLASVAADAGVSRQAVYLHFRSKGQLLLELVEWTDETGRLPHLIEQALRNDNPVARLLGVVKAALVYNGDIAAVGLAVRDARRTDPDAAVAWKDRMDSRLHAFRHHAKPVADAGRLREPWTRTSAADALYVLTSLATYEDLVLDRGWSKARYERHQLELARASLFIDPPGDGP